MSRLPPKTEAQIRVHPTGQASGSRHAECEARTAWGGPPGGKA
jgi:hypothetical protein